MRKFLVVAMALSVCVGFAALAMANTKKVNTKVSINFKAGSSTAPYTEDVFSGEVKAKKGCKKGRKITLNGPSGGGSTKSSSNGSWSISTNARVRHLHGHREEERDQEEARQDRLQEGHLAHDHRRVASR